MKTISKLEIIAALGEKSTALSLRKNELIEKLFELQIAAELQINQLKSHGLIDTKEWGVEFLERKYNSYMMYNGCIIDKFGGRYDGGDYNEWVPGVNYQKLLEFCEKSPEILEGMQAELAEKLDKIELL